MKKIINYLFIILITILISNNIVYAKTNVKDLFQVGNEVKIDKELEGTAFIAGNKVELNKRIDGIGFIAGSEIEVNDTQNYLFAFSTTTNINKDIEKDTFIFSPTINISSNIKRDAYLAGETIDITGNIERNTFIYGTEINLKGTFNGNVTINAQNIKIDKNTIINGTLKYNKDANITGLKDSINSKTYELTTYKLSLKDFISSFINSYLHITILAIVLIFVMEKTFKKSLEQTEDLTIKNILILTGKGFLILIGVPIIAMMLLFSGLFVSVGVISGILYGIILYISKIFVAYLLTEILDKKYLHKNMNGYIKVIFGILILNICSIIPIVGGLISLLITTLGLGIIGNMIIEYKNN